MELEKSIQYSFHDKSIITQALTHSSYANEQKINKKIHNERIEFLGDAVLELVVSEYLYRTYPEKNEGEMTKLRSSLVCEFTLSQCAEDISLGDYLYLSKGEHLTGGRERPSILCDAFEAIIGAIYLDGGFEPAQVFIHHYLLDRAADRTLFYDAKTNLQELVQRDSKDFIIYELIEENGPDHDKEFVVKVIIGEKEVGQGKGKTKKAAEQMAAYQSILKIKNK